MPLPPPPPPVLATLALALDEVAACYRIAASAEGLDLAAEERLLPVESSALAESLDHLLHKLHLAPVAAMPRARWRAILDGQTHDDGLVLIPTSASLLAEILPGPTPSIRIEVASAPMAASVRELLAADA
ncbi:MAG: hypothetical protein ACO3ZY_07850 [Phycisphaerales bacterium]